MLYSSGTACPAGEVALAQTLYLPHNTLPVNSMRATCRTWSDEKMAGTIVRKLHGLVTAPEKLPACPNPHLPETTAATSAFSVCSANASRIKLLVHWNQNQTV